MPVHWPWSGFPARGTTGGEWNAQPAVSVPSACDEGVRVIRYIQGTILKASSNRVVILAGGVGYDVLLPDIVWQGMQDRLDSREPVELFISFHQTVQQPRPVLIGFSSELELEFFERLITVKDIGPVMACRALTMPVAVIARAIEDRDTAAVMQLKGIGRRKADMIVSELTGKVGKFALMRDAGPLLPEVPGEDVDRQVVSVLVKQLGHSRAEAVAMVRAARERTPTAATPEELFEEVYRGTKNQNPPAV